jgi:hypothetical protein
LLLAVGIYFLAISLSRSAYLALGVGIFYLFNKLGLTNKYKKLYVLFIILGALLFIYAAAFKSTLFARPYFEQVVWGLGKWPLGVGVGNFGLISKDPSAPWWSEVASNFSTLTHNVALEMVAGMGVLGLSFLGWLVYVLLDTIKNSRKALFTAVFLAITSNFMFDTTYYIPTMIWLWFIFLGLAQTGIKKRASES